MFYLFYIGLRSHFEEVKTLTKKICRIITSNNFKMTEEREHQIEFICDWFRLTIYDNAKGIQFTSEDYCLELKVLFWFDVYDSEDGTSGENDGIYWITIEKF